MVSKIVFIVGVSQNLGGKEKNLEIQNFRGIESLDGIPGRAISENWYFQQGRGGEGLRTISGKARSVLKIWISFKHSLLDDYLL